MSSRLDAFMGALPGVYNNGQLDSDARVNVAKVLANSGLPVEHAASLGRVNTGSGARLAPGSVATFDARDRSMNMRHDFSDLSRLSLDGHRMLRSSVVHEAMHAVSYDRDPDGYMNRTRIPGAYGAEEGHAENGADRYGRIPGRVSNYDNAVRQRRQMPAQWTPREREGYMAARAGGSTPDDRIRRLGNPAQFRAA